MCGSDIVVSLAHLAKFHVWYGLWAMEMLIMQAINVALIVLNVTVVFVAAGTATPRGCLLGKHFDHCCV